MSRDLYGSSDSRSTYGSLPNGISLRREMTNTLYGSYNEEGIGIPVLLRRLRRDEITLARTPCPCVDSLRLEPDKDTLCPICLGTGYLWDEEWHNAYKVIVGGGSASLGSRYAHHEMGLINRKEYRFFFDYTSGLIEGDQIVEVSLDVEGEIAKPIRRTIVWTPNTIEDKRLDNGRVEFYIATCQQTNAIYIDKDTSQGYVNNP